MKYVLLALLLTGCGHHRVILIDPTVQPFYNSFLAEASKQGKDLKIDSLMITKVSVLPELELGRCDDGDIPIVLILDSYWESASIADKEQLIYHELGHCVLGRKHLDGKLDSGIPISIMNTFHFDRSTYVYYHDYYMRELFLGPFLNDLAGKASSNKDQN